MPQAFGGYHLLLVITYNQTNFTIVVPLRDQKIPSFPNCDNYGIHRASNPNPLNDDTRTNDNELHQQLCVEHLRSIICRKWTLLLK